MNEQLVTVHIERIERAIFLIPGERVMLDRELAALYRNKSLQPGRQAA